MINRRQFISSSAGLATAALLSSCSGVGAWRKRAKVLVVGGGFAGATCAKYLRMWSGGKVDVILLERLPVYVSCPMSNLVASGYKPNNYLTHSYKQLKSWGVNVVFAEATRINSTSRTVSLASGDSLSYDKLVLAPGIDFVANAIPALVSPANFHQIPHAWMPPSQTLLLRKQLVDMQDGGLYAITIPTAPYRCPPGPYERACLVASYFKREKPKSKVLILDANDKIQSKEGLFKKTFADLYANMIEYRPNSNLIDVDVASRSAILEFETVKADVLNVVPPQMAGKIAVDAGLKLINNRWVEINWLTHESTNTTNVHVMGDAIFPAPLMPKSAHMANQQAKVAAAAILNAFDDLPANPQPVLVNTCYSFVDEKNAIHVTSVHQYNKESKSYDVNPNKSGGLSKESNVLEGKIAQDWAMNIWADSGFEPAGPIGN